MSGRWHQALISLGRRNLWSVVLAGGVVLSDGVQVCKHQAGLHHLALKVEGDEDSVEDVDVDQRSVGPWVALHLLHLVLWGEGQG